MQSQNALSAAGGKAHTGAREAQVGTAAAARAPRGALQPGGAAGPAVHAAAISMLRVAGMQQGGGERGARGAEQVPQARSPDALARCLALMQLVSGAVSSLCSYSTARADTS